MVPGKNAQTLFIALPLLAVGAAIWGGTIVLSRWVRSSFDVSTAVWLCITLVGWFPALFSQAPLWWFVKELKRGVADIVLLLGTSAQATATLVAVGAFEGMRQGPSPTLDGTESWLSRGWESTSPWLIGYIVVTLVACSWILLNEEAKKRTDSSPTSA